MKKFSIALMGFGRIGSLHSRVLSKMVQVDKIIVIEIDELKRIEAKNLSQKIVVYSSISECMVNENGIDYLTICTPSTTHYENLRLALDFGLSTLVEKPFVTNLNDGHQLIEDCKNGKLLIGVGHVERYNSSVIKAKELIEIGTIGDIFEIHTRRWGGMPQAPDTGVILDLASHDVDLCRFLLGEEYSQISASAGGWMDAFSKVIESTAVICGISTNQTLISNSVSWRGTAKTREIIILGDKGCLQINTSISELILLQKSKSNFDYENLKFLIGENQSTSTVIDHPKIEPIRAEHLAFQQGLMNSSMRYKVVGLEDAFKSLEVLEAAMVSHTENRVVKLLN